MGLGHVISLPAKGVAVHARAREPGLNAATSSPMLSRGDTMDRAEAALLWIGEDAEGLPLGICGEHLFFFFLSFQTNYEDKDHQKRFLAPLSSAQTL